MKATIKFLNHLVQNAASIDGSSWILGNGILAVCHNLLVCHGTKQLYTGNYCIMIEKWFTKYYFIEFDLKYQIKITVK